MGQKTYLNGKLYKAFSPNELKRYEESLNYNDTPEVKLSNKQLIENYFKTYNFEHVYPNVNDPNVRPFLVKDGIPLVFKHKYTGKLYFKSPKTMEQIARQEVIDNNLSNMSVDNTNIEDTEIYKKLKDIGLSHNFIVKYLEEIYNDLDFNKMNGIPEKLLPQEEYEDVDAETTPDLNKDEINYIMNKMEDNNIIDNLNKHTNNTSNKKNNNKSKMDNNDSMENNNSIDTDDKNSIDTEDNNSINSDMISEDSEDDSDESPKKVTSKKSKTEPQGYSAFRRYLLYNRVIKFADFGRYTVVEGVAFSINCLIFPAILFQMAKTWSIKKNEGFTPWFILLQLLGGAPEGGVGAIIGYIEENSQMLAIGLYAMFYNAFMLFFRIFGTTGYYPLFKEKV